MTHIRTQIRHRFAEVVRTYLDDLEPDFEYEVNSDRRYPKRFEEGTYYVDMMVLNENISQSTMGEERDHEPSFYIRVQTIGPEGELTDRLEAFEVLVLAAIFESDWSDLCEETPEYVQWNTSDDFDNADAAMTMIMRFDCEYRVDRNDVETTIE